ncbi:MAG: N-acetylmuramoyl-L-alanine amidase family protein [Candidatus Polarisedimenticolia bacterium]
MTAQRLRFPGLCIVAVVVALSSIAPRAADEPAAIALSSSFSDDTAVVTLTFSRPVVYRFEETRSRLRLWVEGDVDAASFPQREFDSDVLKRVRLDEGARGTTVVFHLGRRFSAFSTSERKDPFQVVIAFVAEGAPLPPAGEVGLESPAEGAHSATPGAASTQIPSARSGRSQEAVGPLRRVVIDPGHGGDEQGAISQSGLKEKDLVLDIARRLRDRLEEAGYAAALTREADRRVDLESRTATANGFDADLFLSIHANSSLRSTVHGAETYYLSYEASDDEALRVATTENAQGVSQGTKQGEGEDLPVILWEMAQAEHLSRSSRLADLVQTEMNRVGGTANRGVKQAPFRVLVGAAMPAVLVEVGFLTHPDEERKLASGEHRDQIAAALAAAVDRFRQEQLARLGEEAGKAARGGGVP